MVVCTFVFTIVSGLLTPLGVYINQNVFDGGIAVAMNKMPFSEYSIFLVLFVINAILPSILGAYVYTYGEQRSLLIFRTAYKSRMLRKLKTMNKSIMRMKLQRKSSTRPFTGRKTRLDICGPCTFIGVEALSWQASARSPMCSASNGGCC